MTVSFFLHPESAEDILEAFNWYENKRPGLGNEFLLVLEAGFETIRRNPERYPIFKSGLRKFRLLRFPFLSF